MYVRMYIICMYVCMNIRTNVCMCDMCIRTYVCMNIRTYVYMYVCINTCDIDYFLTVMGGHLREIMLPEYIAVIRTCFVCTYDM